MHVRDAVTSRRSIRDFSAEPVSGEVVRRVLDLALRAPSGGNLQPWKLHVLSGNALSHLKEAIAEVIYQHPNGEHPDYQIYPTELVSPYRERRHEIGELLYGQLGIPREDKAQRHAWFHRNFTFFGAPVGLFFSINRRMGPPQWADLGILMQTVMLLLREEGLHSCAQECWALYPKCVGTFLSLPQEHMLFAGMAIGFAREDQAINKIRTPRADTADMVTYMNI